MHHTEPLGPHIEMYTKNDTTNRLHLHHGDCAAVWNEYPLSLLSVNNDRNKLKIALFHKY